MILNQPILPNSPSTTHTARSRDIFAVTVGRGMLMASSG